jgi:DNA invertase Pin-like site-specific DNA recombinase
MYFGSHELSDKVIPTSSHYRLQLSLNDEQEKHARRTSSEPWQAIFTALAQRGREAGCEMCADQREAHPRVSDERASATSDQEMRYTG